MPVTAVLPRPPEWARAGSSAPRPRGRSIARRGGEGFGDETQGVLCAPHPLQCPTSRLEPSPARKNPAPRAALRPRKWLQLISGTLETPNASWGPPARTCFQQLGDFPNAQQPSQPHHCVFQGMKGDGASHHATPSPGCAPAAAFAAEEGCKEGCECWKKCNGCIKDPAVARGPGEARSGRQQPFPSTLAGNSRSHRAASQPGRILR